MIAATAPVRDPDVVVVGAGVAGLAAAQTLINGGRRVQVLEAAPRVGGRCYTDFSSFGLPFDQGAMWLRDADHNPLFGFAKLHQFETSLPRPKEILFANGRNVSPASNAAYERAYDGLSMAMAEAAEESEQDLAASAVTMPALDPEAGSWLSTAATQIGPIDMGVDLEQVSVRDWFYRNEAEPSRLVRQGLGTLASRLSASLPVLIGAQVTRIASGARGRISVYTNSGEIVAKTVIVTASIGVLQAGSISFEPGFSPELQDALASLTMGSTIKIAMAFGASSPSVQFGSNSVLLSRNEDQRGAEFLVRPFGTPLAICTAGGSLALDLESRSARDHREFAVESLRSLLGSSADLGLRGTVASSWGRNPLVLGSVSAARPGGWSAREALQQPIAERVFLAGEALGGKAVQTVHGAYYSGHTVARRVLSLLRRKG